MLAKCLQKAVFGREIVSSQGWPITCWSPRSLLIKLFCISLGNSRGAISIQIATLQCIWGLIGSQKTWKIRLKKSSQGWPMLVTPSTPFHRSHPRQCIHFLYRKIVKLSKKCNWYIPRKGPCIAWEKRVYRCQQPRERTNKMFSCRMI